jgi:hypothetical protein
LLSLKIAVGDALAGAILERKQCATLNNAFGERHADKVSGQIVAQVRV